MATVNTNVLFSNAVNWATQKLTIQDSTSYPASSEGPVWSSSNSRGLIKVVDPNGDDVIDNTDKSNPNITTGGGSYEASLPLNDTNILQGTYLVTLTLFDNSQTTPTAFTQADITTGTDEIAITGHGFSAGQAVVFALTSGAVPTTTPTGGIVDGDTYYVNVVSANAIKLCATYALAIAGTAIDITATPTGAYTLTAVDYKRTYSLNIDFDAPKIVLDPSYSVINPVFLKCTDDTVYKTNGVTPTVTRAWTLTYPDGNGTYTSTDATLNTGVFYGSKKGAMNQIKLISTAVYTFGGYYSDATSTNVNYSLSYVTTTYPDKGGLVVYTDTSGCDSYCCVKRSYENYVNASNADRRNKFKLIWEEATGLMQMIQSAYDCNDPEAVSTYKTRLSFITSCNGGCGCNDDEDIQQVVGIGTTPNITRLYEYTMASTASTLTISDVFKNYSFSDGDFICFVDSGEITSTTGYTPSYNSNTGVFSFGAAVAINTQVSFYIIKP